MLTSGKLCYGKRKIDWNCLAQGAPNTERLKVEFLTLTLNGCSFSYKKNILLSQSTISRCAISFVGPITKYSRAKCLFIDLCELPLDGYSKVTTVRFLARPKDKKAMKKTLNFHTFGNLSFKFYRIFLSRQSLKSVKGSKTSIPLPCSSLPGS